MRRPTPSRSSPKRAVWRFFVFTYTRSLGRYGSRSRFATTPSSRARRRGGSRCLCSLERQFASTREALKLSETRAEAEAAGDDRERRARKVSATLAAAFANGLAARSLAEPVVQISFEGVKSMKPMLSDAVLRDAVMKELYDDPEVAAKHISVTAIDGAITLGGHVRAIHEKHLAVRAAERVDAVRAVADDIEVREPSLHERADDEIAEEIAHLRSWHAQIPDSVGVQVRNGCVILHRPVESASQREAAEAAVRQLTGVRVVDNLITVKSRTEPARADVEHRVQKAIS